MKIGLAITLVLFAFTGVSQSLVRGYEPDTVLARSWQNMEFLEEVGTADVLIWLDKKDPRPFEVRSCITISTSFDSIGNMEYLLKHIYANDSEFKKWTTTGMHYEMDYRESVNAGYVGGWDWHVEKFEHRPSKAEMEELLEKWRFFVDTGNWTVVSFGLNKQVWMDVFGFVPEFNVDAK